MNRLNRIIRNVVIKRMNSSISGGQIIYNKLIENKVKDMFLYSGGAIMPAVDAFYKGDINFYINTHEQSLGHAATGYAKSTGKPGVCMVTSGPGLTNMITPMTDANNDSTPLIVFSGNVPLKSMGTQAFQECPSTDITRPITKWSYCVNKVDELSDVIDEAFKVSTNGKKGCVHIDVPKCISSGVIDIDNYENLRGIYHYNNKISKQIIIKEDLNNVINIINNSKKPILIVGQGANDSWQYIREFAIKSGIPVTTTIHGMGIFDENHKLSVNFLGMHGNAAANYAVQNSDLIINIGSRFDDRTTGNVLKYAPEAFKAFNEGRGGIIHVNINGDEINKNINSQFNFQMDATSFIETIYSNIKVLNRRNWLDQIKTWENENPFRTNEPLNTIINSQMVIQSINKNLDRTKNFNITTGVGNHQMWAAQFIKYDKPRTYISSGSLGVMGAGLPYAIGVQVANPNNLVVDIDGDGSFNHTLAELKTVANYNLPIKIAIMNDGKMSMVRAWEHLFFNSRYAATDLYNNPDYVKLANSFGIKAISCNSKSILDDTVRYFLNYEGPILCDFKVRSELCFPLVKPGNALDEMFLSRDKMDLSEIDTENVPS